ncbi:MAG: hypothetical protein K2K57_10920 [Oscillospiraceae bacterium]|nr:hypothetical protein [Oscillospiraceae bacterium]
MELNDKIYNQILKLCNKGDKLLEKSKFEAAIKQYTKALELVPHPKEFWEASTWIYAALGEVYFLKNDHNSALNEFMNAYNCPDGISNPFINLRIGECYYKVNDIANAKEYLLRAYMTEGDKIFEGEEAVYLRLIESITTDNGSVKKESKLSSAPNNKEIDEAAMIDRYNAFCKNQEYNKAIDELEATLNSLSGDKYSHSESFLIVWLILSAAIKINDTKAMEKWVDKVFIADPAADYHGERELWAGKALFELKRYDEARDYLKAAYAKSDSGRCFTAKDKKYLDFINS